MRLVYRIGQAYGYELDSGHVKDFLATVGVGLTSQYLEQAGRKLLGGLLGRVAGGLGRGIVQRGLQLLQRCVQRGALLRIQHLQQLLLACARLRQDAARQRAAGGVIATISRRPWAGSASTVTSDCAPRERSSRPAYALSIASARHSVASCTEPSEFSRASMRHSATDRPCARA
jgi:hypothetical protein